MIVTDFYKQLSIIVEHFCAGNLKAFANTTGINHATLHRNLTAQRDDLLVRHAPAILRAYPSVSESWLYTGEGEMLVPERPMAIRSAVNGNGKIIGDFLWEFFGARNLDIDAVCRICHFRKDLFEQVMESSRYPSWQELLTLHEVFGLNVHFLFFDRGYWSVPQTSLERIEHALNMSADRDADMLAEAMGIDEGEFIVWLKKYRKARADRLAYMEKHGTLGTVYIEDEDDYLDAPCEPPLPAKWLDALEKNYSLASSYVRGAATASHLSQRKLAEENARLLEEVSNLWRGHDDLRDRIQEQKAMISLLEERYEGVAPIAEKPVKAARTSSTAALSSRRGRE